MDTRTKEKRKTSLRKRYIYIYLYMLFIIGMLVLPNTRVGSTSNSYERSIGGAETIIFNISRGAQAWDHWAAQL